MTTVTAENNVMTERFSRSAVSPEQFGEIVQELERVSKTRIDYVAPAKDVRVGIDEANRTFMSLDMGGVTGNVKYDVTRIAHEQLSDRLNIPLPYYRRLAGGHAALLAANINYWLKMDPNRHFLLRTLDARVRAVLSNSYRILDNYDLFFQVMTVAKDIGATPQRFDLTDENFYLRLVAPDYVERIDFRTGRGKDRDDVIPGIVVRNSEVGRGGLSVTPFIYNQVCSNGMWGDTKLTQVHLGKRLEAGYLSVETREQEDRALWLAVRDLTRATFDREQFSKMIDQLRGAATEQLEHPQEAVEAVVKHYGFSDEMKQSILDELISPQTRENDPGRTVYGLLQAITAQAHKVENADDKRVFEQAGGDFLGRARELVAVRGK